MWRVEHWPQRGASDPAATTCLLCGFGLSKPVFAHLSLEFLCEATTRQGAGSTRHESSTQCLPPSLLSWPVES